MFRGFCLNVLCEGIAQLCRNRLIWSYNFRVLSTVERLDGNHVKLTVQIDPDEFQHDVEAAFRRIAKQVRVPGFRPGKVPRRVLETRLGRETGREEALRECLPRYYQRALIANNVDAVAVPEIEITGGNDHDSVHFDAVVEVRPDVIVSGYDGMRVQVPSVVSVDEDVEAEIREFRRQFAELSSVNRAAMDGDHLTINITCHSNGELVEGLTASDYDYRLGSGRLFPEMDKNLDGASVGDVLAFAVSPPEGGSHAGKTSHTATGGSATDADSGATGGAAKGDANDSEGGRAALHFKVLVKDVQEAVMPDLDDELVAANSEYQTVDEFEASVYETCRSARRSRFQAVSSEAVGEAIAGLVEDEVPVSMVASHVDGQIEARLEELKKYGRIGTLDEYLDVLGKSEGELRAELEPYAKKEVKIDLALRAIALAEALHLTDEELDENVRGVVAQMSAESLRPDDVSDEEVAQTREVLNASGKLAELQAVLMKRNAWEWVQKRAIFIDDEGSEVDAAEILQDADETA